MGPSSKVPRRPRGGDRWPVVVDQEQTMAVDRIGEAQSLVEAPRVRATAERGQSVRVLLLGDNMAVCLAFERRRAASVRILRLIRCFAAICFANNLRTSILWVPSEENAADHPCRHHHGEHHRTLCATSATALPEPSSPKDYSQQAPRSLRRISVL